ncbi:hypothetical protein RSO01_88130 [Reyranella soli]|uniref:Uncharacterized protein n=1 Tax=Reyranella soli TaxID=1230389 RepID=A0A512NRT4_9HYPH|nr:hypothetical protein RSO01_88130 [Reyranella soli]
MAELKDAATGHPGRDNRLSISSGVGDWLFQKNMLAGAKSLLREDSMKMVG